MGSRCGVKESAGVVNDATYSASSAARINGHFGSYERKEKGMIATKNKNRNTRFQVRK